jgi:hypothetical protein
LKQPRESRVKFPERKFKHEKNQRSWGFKTGACEGKLVKGQGSGEDGWIYLTTANWTGAAARKESSLYSEPFLALPMLFRGRGFEWGKATEEHLGTRLALAH